MSVCRSCGAPVLWSISDAGRRTPLDADPADDGTLTITGRDPDGTPHVTYTPPDQLLIDDLPRYRSHFASCPDAESWRNPR